MEGSIAFDFALPQGPMCDKTVRLCARLIRALHNMSAVCSGINSTFHNVDFPLESRPTSSHICARLWAVFPDTGLVRLIGQGCPAFWSVGQCWQFAALCLPQPFFVAGKSCPYVFVPCQRYSRHSDHRGWSDPNVAEQVWYSGSFPAALIYHPS